MPIVPYSWTWPGPHGSPAEPIYGAARGGRRFRKADSGRQRAHIRQFPRDAILEGMANERVRHEQFLNGRRLARPVERDPTLPEDSMHA
eukprot:5530893-Prymnesium_polylepis.1